MQPYCMCDLLFSSSKRLNTNDTSAVLVSLVLSTERSSRRLTLAGNSN